MRMDKLTNQLQSALADAQSLALGKDHNFIEPVHLLGALLEQQGGSARPLLQKAGADMSTLRGEVQGAIDTLPTVSGAGGDVHISPALARVLNVTDKLAQQGGDTYISSELVLLALLESKDKAGDTAETVWCDGRQPQRPPSTRLARWRGREQSGGRGIPPGAGEVHHRPDRTGRGRASWTR